MDKKQLKFQYMVITILCTICRMMMGQWHYHNDPVIKRRIETAEEFRDELRRELNDNG